MTKRGTGHHWTLELPELVLRSTYMLGALLTQICQLCSWAGKLHLLSPPETALC